MSLTFGSVCSGIEAASVAWEPLGMKAAWYCEIEPFPSAVLAHHYPKVTNYGDFTKLIDKEHTRASVDVLVGGTPCQAFSVAGLRGGLAAPRGNLALAFVALVDSLRPRWIVWENVRGVLSSGGGRDFGSFLGALGQLGYGWSYRVLDAQYFGVAQRRKRVFLVANIGDWRRAAAVLFEPQVANRAVAEERKKGKGYGSARPDVCAEGALGVDLYNMAVSGSVAVTLTTTGGGAQTGPFILDAKGIRRLLPVEMERLQGFSDHYTAIPYRGKPASECPDGPRAKALGNSMAVPCMSWIGKRLLTVDALSR